MKILSVFGTRPEAIKMAPLVKELSADPYFDARVCVTAQHRHLLDQVLNIFGINPDIDLNLMRQDQAPEEIIGDILHALKNVFSNWRPDMVLVHGDTSTTLATALAAFHARIPIGHVEAGLRTGNKHAPWPEEINRRLTGILADVHFAPTLRAQENLLREGVLPSCIHVTGNTGIDALLYMVKCLHENSTLRNQQEARFSFLDEKKALILITGHRRENFRTGLASVCRAIVRMARRSDVQVIYPVHPNPQVQKVVQQLLDHPNIFLLDPLDYPSFVYLLERSSIILTDSGGVQEEAPALGKPVFVLREQTERPEAVEAGAVHLIGTNEDNITEALTAQLSGLASGDSVMQPIFPYGDGSAARQIAHILKMEQIS